MTDTADTPGVFFSVLTFPWHCTHMPQPIVQSYSTPRNSVSHNMIDCFACRSCLPMPVSSHKSSARLHAAGPVFIMWNSSPHAPPLASFSPLFCHAYISLFVCINLHPSHQCHVHRNQFQHRIERHCSDCAHNWIACRRRILQQSSRAT